MSHLPKVDFAPDAPPALECIIALTRCTIAGEIDDAIKADPSNVWLNVSRVGEAGLDRIPKNDASGNPSLFMISQEEGKAWADLADALQIGESVTMPLRADTQAISADSIPWEVIIQAAVAAFQRWMQRRRGG